MQRLEHYKVDMSKEMARLFEEEKLDNFTAHTQVATAKEHYDKEDLI
jgi:hypothetical protein